MNVNQIVRQISMGLLCIMILLPSFIVYGNRNMAGDQTGAEILEVEDGYTEAEGRLPPEQEPEKVPDPEEAAEPEEIQEPEELPDTGEAAEPEDTELLETEPENGSDEVDEEVLSEEEPEITQRLESLGNWTNYNGLIFGNATIYDTTSGGGLAVGGSLTVNRDLTIGSTYASEYDPTLHIGEYKNDDRLPALLSGGNQLSVGPAVQSLQVYGGAIAMSEELLELNSQLETGFEPLTDSRYESVRQEELDNWFTYQHKVVSFTSRNLGQANDVSITLQEFSDGSYLDYGAAYFQNQYFEVQDEVYENALVITVRTDSDVDFGQWWPVYSMVYVDVNWALDYDLVVFDFPDAVNVTMNSSAFQIQNMSHWSTTVDAWIGELGMKERLALSERVVYNFPNARSVEAVQALIQGTILAPEATFTGIGAGGNGHIYGHIIARNYVVQGNFTIHAFHLTRWIYDLVDDTLREDQEKGTIRLRHYLFLREQATSIRLSGGEYVLLDPEGRYYTDGGGFTDNPEKAAVFTSSAEAPVSITEVPYGTYTLRNTKAPDGFWHNQTRPEQIKTWYETEVELEEAEVTILHYSEPVMTDITFKKTDRETGVGIEGAVFAIVREADEYEDTTIGSRYESDEEGLFTSYSLPAGTYRLIEGEIPEGYEMLENGEFRFQVVWNETMQQLNVLDMEGNIWEGTGEDPVEIYNDPGDGNNTLTLVKYANREEAGGVSYTLPGAVFDLFLYEENSGWAEVTDNLSGERVEIETNELGYDRVEHLAAGVYRLVETRPPEGYGSGNQFTDAAYAEVFPEGYAYEFAFTEDNTSYTAYVGSGALSTDITVQLTGAFLKEMVQLSDAAFRLEHLLREGNTWEEVFYRAYTDEQGQLKLEGLEAGMYRLTQVSSTAGYHALDPSVLTLEISFQEGRPVVEVLYNRIPAGPDTVPVSFRNEEELLIDIVNETKTRNYGVYKIDADYETLAGDEGNTTFRIQYLEGAQFRLRRRTSTRSGWNDYGGIFTSVYQYDEEGQPVRDNYGNHVTQALFQEGLMYGDYQLVEVAAPEGYMTGSDIEVTFEDGTTGSQLHLFTITESMTGTGQTTVYTAADYKTGYAMDLNLKKADQTNQTTGLKGAEFALYMCDEVHEHDAQVTEDSCWAESIPILRTSNAKGMVQFSDLPSGEYILLEKKAPPGYRLSAVQWLVTVAAHAGNIEITGSDGSSVYQDADGDQAIFLITDQKKFVLPFTGGGGIGQFLTAGAAVTAAGLAGIIWRNKKKGRNEIEKKKN